MIQSLWLQLLCYVLHLQQQARYVRIWSCVASIARRISQNSFFLHLLKASYQNTVLSGICCKNNVSTLFFGTSRESKHCFRTAQCCACRWSKQGVRVPFHCWHDDTQRPRCHIVRLMKDVGVFATSMMTHTTRDKGAWV